MNQNKKWPKIKNDPISKIDENQGELRLLKVYPDKLR